MVWPTMVWMHSPAACKQGILSIALNWVDSALTWGALHACAVQLKVVEKSGLNRDGTYLPPAIHPTFAKEPKYDMKTAMVEAEMVMGGVVADLLEKTGAFKAQQQRWQLQHDQLLLLLLLPLPWLLAMIISAC